MDGWSLILEIVLLLGVATLLGLFFEYFKQSSVIGYLIAGILLGPSVLGVIQGVEVVRYLAELGVALLLFTIGLEFSWTRLKSLGVMALGGGSLQILLTGATGYFLSRLFGLEQAESFVIGASISMSSTAVVLRVLTDRAELESSSGRNVLGILLLQDLAVVPLVLVVSALSGNSDKWETGLEFVAALAKGCVFFAVLYFLTRLVLPRVLSITSIYRNRDLPVLLSVTMALGSTWASHAVGLSPILGAFLAGLLLAESPFAEQIRAEISPLRAAFVTLFFTSIGTLAPIPTVGFWDLVTSVLTILVIKTLVVAFVSLLFRQPLEIALSTGIALAQMGEFSFVLSELAWRSGLLSMEVFHLIISSSVVTLILTPFLIAANHPLRHWVRQFRRGRPHSHLPSEEPSNRRERVVVVGYGPAGRKTAETLAERNIPYLVLEFNPQTVAACGSKIPVVFGDATRADILEHLHLRTTRAMVITVPDTRTVKMIVGQVKRLDPAVQLVVRNRYHAYTETLERSGADELVDEEELVGRKLGLTVLTLLGR